MQKRFVSTLVLSPSRYWNPTLCSVSDENWRLGPFELESRELMNNASGRRYPISHPSPPARGMLGMQSRGSRKRLNGLIVSTIFPNSVHQAHPSFRKLLLLAVGVVGIDPKSPRICARPYYILLLIQFTIDGLNLQLGIMRGPATRNCRSPPDEA